MIESQKQINIENLNSLSKEIVRPIGLKERSWVGEIAMCLKGEFDSTPLTPHQVEYALREVQKLHPLLQVFPSNGNFIKTSDPITYRFLESGKNWKQEDFEKVMSLPLPETAPRVHVFIANKENGFFFVLSICHNIFDGHSMSLFLTQFLYFLDKYQRKDVGDNIIQDASPIPPPIESLVNWDNWKPDLPGKPDVVDSTLGPRGEYTWKKLEFSAEELEFMISLCDKWKVSAYALHIALCVEALWRTYNELHPEKPINQIRFFVPFDSRRHITSLTDQFLGDLSSGMELVYTFPATFLELCEQYKTQVKQAQKDQGYFQEIGSYLGLCPLVKHRHQMTMLGTAKYHLKIGNWDLVELDFHASSDGWSGGGVYGVYLMVTPNSGKYLMKIVTNYIPEIAEKLTNNFRNNFSKLKALVGKTS